ncbi:MAG TPA: hypothetical protein ENN33_05740 [Ignavibacteria bacterium]|nr:hypothetical protein [Ignavibacteria bacterium]
MKNKKMFFVLTFLAILITSVFAASKAILTDIIEKNYLVGISSTNQGLKVSSAYFLGEMKSSKAVIPLMKILREDKSESARLASALALVKIGDARGIFMVKRTVDFNDHEKVRKLAKHLYSAYLIGDEQTAHNDVNFALAVLK